MILPSDRLPHGKAGRSMCHVFSHVKPVRADRDDVAVLLDDVIELVAWVCQLFGRSDTAVPVKEKDEVFRPR
jgi:hypothetical protein